jgi:hypothetical protein
MTRDFFFQLNPCCHSPAVTSSLMRGWVCLLWIVLAFVMWTYLIYSMLLKILPCSLYTSTLSGQTLQSRSCLSYLCYNGSLVTLMVVGLTATKLEPLIFSMCGFALSYAVNMYILMILYDFCLLPAQFCYIIVCIQKVESRVQITDRCAPWKISNGAENLVLQVLQF